jgi:ferritin-like protein
MTATELVVEKAKNLSESQAELVLAYIDNLAVPPPHINIRLNAVAGCAPSRDPSIPSDES